MMVMTGVAPRSAAAHGPGRPLAALLIAASLLLTGCSVLEKPVRPALFDFGPGPVVGGTPVSTLPTLALAEVEAAGALEATAVLYRLAFSNANQLLPYAQARWSMPPAQLVRQRLREVLGQSRHVVSPGDGNLAGGAPGLVLRVELEEFSQVFDSANASAGLLRLRATVIRTTTAGDNLLGQRLFVVRRNASTNDAAGGVSALAEASLLAAQEIDQWLTQFR